MRDTLNHIDPVPVLAPAVGTDDTPLVGAIVNRSGYDSLTYVIQTGTLADAAATWIVLLEHGDACHPLGCRGRAGCRY
jgi:hypothetical protein